MSHQNPENLIWIDLEMTGLDPLEDRTIVTDKNLKIIEEGPTLAIKQSDEMLAGMDEWCTTQHGKSGLTDRVKNSSVSEATAEAVTLAFLDKYVPRGRSPMCGNSICQDRRFLARWMPELEEFFHYRNLDVSTLKELARRWAPEIYDGFDKESSHLAMDDIKDSIAELRYYRKTILSI
jgi:oligoribonuclease